MTRKDIFKEISETLDEWTYDEKMFALFYLLPNLKMTLEKQEFSCPKEEYANRLYKIIEKNLKAVDRIENVLAFELFY